MSAQNPDFLRKNKAPAGMSAENPDFLRKNKAPAGMSAENPDFLRKKSPCGHARSHSIFLIHRDPLERLYSDARLP